MINASLMSTFREQLLKGSKNLAGSYLLWLQLSDVKLSLCMKTDDLNLTDDLTESDAYISSDSKVI